MWIMGVSVVISFRSLRHRQVRPMTICVKLLRRTIILFGLGLFVSNCKSALLSIIDHLGRVYVGFQSCAKLVDVHTYILYWLLPTGLYSCNLHSCKPNLFFLIYLLTTCYSINYENKSICMCLCISVCSYATLILHTQMQTSLTTGFPEFCKDLLLVTLLLHCFS